MPIPDFRSLMLPVLRRVAGGVRATPAIVAGLADELALTPGERDQRLGNGQFTFANRVHWALSFLGRAGLVGRVARGTYEATPDGHAVVAAPPDRITVAWLGRFPAFAAVRATPAGPRDGEAAGAAGPSGVAPGAEPPRPPAVPDGLDPGEAFERAVAELDAALAADLLDAVRAMPAGDFERLLIALLRALGFGGTHADAARRLGGTGDGGVDGVISEDALGLDVLYVQAKRYAAANTVGAGAIREFAGALLAHGARKGVFATTSAFTAAAREEAARLATQQRIVLLDGAALARLMLEHDVGVRTVRVVKRRRVDLAAFSEDAELGWPRCGRLP